MSSYYVGYGHASIGDCGVTTLFIEDISLLACKAVQDNQLYSGQESSTRYIDFSKQRLHNPAGSTRGEEILRRWIDFYSASSSKLIDSLKTRFPNVPGTNDKTWAKAIEARAFDILRGFLPAGVTSQVSWTTNLRQAHENTLRLELHPLKEVRDLGSKCRQILIERYPNSFSHQVSDDELDYLRRVSIAETYNSDEERIRDESAFEVSSTVYSELPASARDLLSSRPRRSVVPRALARYGSFECRFLLDFGSFRDLQRHRPGICRMPLLSGNYGFNSWYLSQLPGDLRLESQKFVEEQVRGIQGLLEDGLSTVDAQYYYPLGMNVLCELHYDLPEMIYVAELRSGQTVHPTLRSVAQRMAAELLKSYPFIQLHADMRDSSFSVRRGEQDIVPKNVG